MSQFKHHGNHRHGQKPGHNNNQQPNSAGRRFWNADTASYGFIRFAPAQKKSEQGATSLIFKSTFATGRNGGFIANKRIGGRVVIHVRQGTQPQDPVKEYSFRALGLGKTGNVVFCQILSGIKIVRKGKRLVADNAVKPWFESTTPSTKTRELLDLRSANPNSSFEDFEGRYDSSWAPADVNDHRKNWEEYQAAQAKEGSKPEQSEFECSECDECRGDRDSCGCNSYSEDDGASLSREDSFREHDLKCWNCGFADCRCDGTPTDWPAEGNADTRCISRSTKKWPVTNATSTAAHFYV